MILKAQDQQLIKGIAVNQNIQQVSVIQYADVTKVLREHEQGAVDNLKAIILWFGAVSGLKINERKSRIFPISENQDMEQLKQIW